MAVNSHLKNENNYYELLEVSPNAPQNEIHEAFRRAKRTYSPDSPALYNMFSPEEARDLMQLIEEAFSILGNQALRREYDEKLRRQTNPAFTQPHPTMKSEGNFQNHFDSFMHTASSEMVIPEAEAFHYDEPSETQIEAPGVPVAKEQPKSATGKTVLSTYELDPAFEEEIAQQTIFDGTFLKKVREYKRIGLPRLSDHSRISQTYLRALEANDYEALPAPVFVRGFVTQVAKALEIDHQAAAASYMKLFKDAAKR